MKILDLSTLLPGPLASKLLLDIADEVIRVENPMNIDLLKTIKPTNNGVGVAYCSLNKNKTIKYLDFRKPEDKEKLIGIIQTCDVLIENHRPGRLDKMGLGYEDSKKYNNKLIYCSITGYGYNNRLSQYPAHDLNILALSGYLDYQNRSCPPSIPPCQIADVLTSYNAVVQILKKLYKHEAGWLDVSMLDSVKNLFEIVGTTEQYTQKNISPDEMPLWGAFPCYKLYKTKDSKYVALAAIEPQFWNDFCIDNHCEDMTEQQYSLDREVISRIEGIISAKNRDEWGTYGTAYCLTPVYSYLEYQRILTT